MKNTSLFDDTEPNDWREHWIGMPEYNNVPASEPAIVATFKFRNEMDFIRFNRLIKEHLYDGEKPFDGMQRKTVKSTWFPLNEKAKGYRYR